MVNCNCKINVVVPMYNTKVHDLESCLSSILMQTLIRDTIVVLVDDCSNNISQLSDVIDKFSWMMEINLIKLNENRGVGNARNIGLQNCDGDYVIFCDSDDVFLSPFSFETMIKPFLENDNVDISMCSFYEQIPNSTDKIKHGYNLTWLHGKCYRLDFLRSNNIQFPELRTNEDVAFNLLCWCLSDLDRIAYVDEPVHIWRSNQDSITRKEKPMDKRASEMLDFVKSYLILEEELKDRGLMTKSFVIEQNYACLIMLYWYAVDMRNIYVEEFVEKYDELCSEFLSVVLMDSTLTDYVNNELFESTYINSLTKCEIIVKRNVPSITIYDWLLYIAKIADVTL